MTKRDLQNQIDALREQIIMANGRIRALEYDFNMQTADVVELEGSKVDKYLSYTTTGIPTADVRKNVHAHWEIVYDEDCDSGGKYICGNCGHAFSFGAYFELCRFDYCPNCGAHMDERRNDGD